MPTRMRNIRGFEQAYRGFTMYHAPFSIGLPSYDLSILGHNKAARLRLPLVDMISQRGPGEAYSVPETIDVFEWLLFVCDEFLIMCTRFRYTPYRVGSGYTHARTQKTMDGALCSTGWNNRYQFG